VSAFCIIFCAASIRPGVAVVRTSSAPLTFGFSQMFRIPFEHAIAFTLIAKFATCLCFSFAYSTQITALSQVGLPVACTALHLHPRALLGVREHALTGCATGHAMIVIWYWDKDYKVYAMNGYLLLLRFVCYGIVLTRTPFIKVVSLYIIEPLRFNAL
jgi:hypothetical protein